jgi:hypothetical protein
VAALEVVPFDLGAKLPHHERVDVRWCAANADDPAAPARTGRDDAPRRSLGYRDQDGRAFKEASLRGIELAIVQHTFDPAEDRGDDARHVLVGRCGGRMEHRLATRRKVVRAVQEERVVVNAEIDRRVKALDHRHRRGLERAADAEQSHPPPKPRGHSPNELPQHHARQRWVERQLHAKTMRNGQDALSHGHVRDYSIHEADREVAHPSSDAARAEATSFAAKRDRTTPPAVRAFRQDQTMRQDPAAQVRFHFRDHEGGEHGRFSGRLELGEECLPVLLHRLVEHGVLGSMSLISRCRRS